MWRKGMLHFFLAPEWAQLAALLSQVNPVDVAISGHRQSAISEDRHRTVEIAEHWYSGCSGSSIIVDYPQFTPGTALFWIDHPLEAETQLNVTLQQAFEEGCPQHGRTLSCRGALWWRGSELAPCICHDMKLSESVGSTRTTIRYLLQIARSWQRSSILFTVHSFPKNSKWMQMV